MIRPTGTNVVIEPTEEKLSDTIFVADGNREPSCYGIVVAVGPKVSPDDLGRGDRVFCGRYEGKKIWHEEKEFRVIPLEAVLARFTAEAT